MGSLDFATIGNVKVECSNISTLAKAARMGHPLNEVVKTGISGFIPLGR
jgi:hypothetical protein